MYLIIVHNLTQRTVKVFQNLLCSWNPWVLLSRSQLVNPFLVSLPKKQQVNMTQAFGHFQWSLKCWSPNYNTFLQLQKGIFSHFIFFLFSKSFCFSSSGKFLYCLQPYCLCFFFFFDKPFSEVFLYYFDNTSWWFIKSQKF